MRYGIVALLFIIVVGVMLATIVTNPTGTQAVFNGITTFWRTSVNGLLGYATSGTGKLVKS